MKLFIILFFILYVPLVSQQLDNNFLLNNIVHSPNFIVNIKKPTVQVGVEDSILTEYKLVWENNRWRGEDFRWYFYGDNGRQSHHITYTWLAYNINSWVFKEKEYFVYDVNNNLIYDTLHLNDNVYGVIPLKAWTYLYKNNLLIEQTQKWYKSEKWFSADSVYFVYNNDTLRECYVTLYNSIRDSIFVSDYYRALYYFENNNMNYIGISQDFDGKNWINLYKNYHHFNSKGQLKELVVQVWKNNNWYNDTRTYKEYDSLDNVTYWADQYWVVDHWFTNIDVEFKNFYDKQNNLIEKNLGGTRYIYNYDEKNRIIEMITQNKNNDVWINSEKVIYNYKEHLLLPSPVSVENTSYTNTNIIYPNPAVDQILINNLETTQNISFDIYDIFGNKIHSITPNRETIGNNPIRINVSSLQTGTYFLLDSQNEDRKVVKFMVIR